MDNGFLNFSSPDVNGYGYCVFGKVIEGMETVDKIEKAVRTALPWYSFEIYVEPDIYSAKHVHA